MPRSWIDGIASVVCGLLRWAMRVVDQGQPGRIDSCHVVFKLCDRFLDVVEGSVSIFLLEFTTQHFAIDDFETRDVEHAVVETLGESRQVAVDEFAVLGDGIAANDDRILLFEMREDDLGEALIELFFSDALWYAFEESALGVMVLAPVVHVFENIGWLLNSCFPFEDGFEKFVRYNHPGFENPIGHRIESGHFEVYPAKSTFRHNGMGNIALLIV